MLKRVDLIIDHSQAEPCETHVYIFLLEKYGEGLIVSLQPLRIPIYKPQASSSVQDLHFALNSSAKQSRFAEPTPLGVLIKLVTDKLESMRSTLNTVWTPERLQ